MKIQGLHPDGCRGYLLWSEGRWTLRISQWSLGRRANISRHVLGDEGTLLAQLQEAGAHVAAVTFSDGSYVITPTKEADGLRVEGARMTRTLAKRHRRYDTYPIKWNWDIS